MTSSKLLQLQRKLELIELIYTFLKAYTFAFCGLMWWKKPENSGKTTDFGRASTENTVLNLRMKSLDSLRAKKNIHNKKMGQTIFRIINPRQ